MSRKDIKPESIATLAEAIYEVIHHSDIPLRRIADQMGIEVSTLTRYGLEGSSGADMPLKRLPSLILATKRFLVLDFIEKSLGRVAFQLPSTSQQLTRDIASLTIKTIKEFSDFLQEIERSLNDNGTIDADEYKRIQWEGYQALQKILELMSACEVKRD